jgi:hypothetical protein
LAFGGHPVMPGGFIGCHFYCSARVKAGEGKAENSPLWFGAVGIGLMLRVRGGMQSIRSCPYPKLSVVLLNVSVQAADSPSFDFESTSCAT